MILQGCLDFFLVDAPSSMARNSTINHDMLRGLFYFLVECPRYHDEKWGRFCMSIHANRGGFLNSFLVACTQYHVKMALLRGFFYFLVAFPWHHSSTTVLGQIWAKIAIICQGVFLFFGYIPEVP